MHRDIKPDNIFVKIDEATNKVRVKLGDLGLAKFQRQPRSVRNSFSREAVSNAFGNLFTSNAATSDIGTFAYMAPEQRKSFYDQKVDIYALGMLLWELNETNFDRDERHFTLMRVRKTGCCGRWCNLKSPEASALIEKMIHHDPSSRPTASEILATLDKM